MINFNYASFAAVEKKKHIYCKWPLCIDAMQAVKPSNSSQNLNMSNEFSDIFKEINQNNKRNPTHLQ